MGKPLFNLVVSEKGDGAVELHWEECGEAFLFSGPCGPPVRFECPVMHAHALYLCRYVLLLHMSVTHVRFTILMGTCASAL